VKVNAAVSEFILEFLMNILNLKIDIRQVERFDAVCGGYPSSRFCTNIKMCARAEQQWDVLAGTQPRGQIG